VTETDLTLLCHGGKGKKSGSGGIDRAREGFDLTMSKSKTGKPDERGGGGVVFIEKRKKGWGVPFQANETEGRTLE